MLQILLAVFIVSDDNAVGSNERIQKQYSLHGYKYVSTIYWISGLRPSSRNLNQYLEFRMMDKTLRPSNSQRYTPSSEPFKFYLNCFEFVSV
jgi:hypothetical protein